MKKYFNKLLDGDSAEFIVDPNSYINARNFRFGSTDKGGMGYGENIYGNTLISNTLPVGTNTTIGGVTDEEKSRIIYFNHNSAGTHGIYCFDKDSATVYKVLLNSQVTGGLGFSTSNLIHSAVVVGDLLFWVDNLNEPRVINIEAGIKLNHGSYSTSVSAYSSPLVQEDIALIKKPPVYVPTTTKGYNSSVPTNFIQDGVFQFALMYEYRDYQRSVIGNWTKLVNFNAASDNSNYITVKASLFEVIHQTVQKVHLLSKNMLTGGVSIVRTWDKSNTDDAADIVAHNSGTALSYDFYNNITGITVSQTEASRIEDLVPPIVQTLESARKRIFLGNYFVGHNQPNQTSLSVSVIDANSSSSITTAVYRYRANFQNVYYDPDANYVDVWYAGYYVFLSSVAVPGWYLINGTEDWDGFTYPVLGSIPSSVAFADLTYQGADTSEIISNIQHDSTPGTAPDELYYSTYSVEMSDQSTNTDITSVSTTGVAAFKTNSPYQVGIAFYDRFKRRIGMITNDDLLVNIPDRDFDYTDFKAAIEWTLSSGAQPNEIPEGAYYYSIVRTQNLRTRFFLQSVDDQPRYAAKGTDGVITIDSVFPSQPDGKAYLALDTNNLLKEGMGYTFNDGDLCAIYYDGATGGAYQVKKVVAQEGRYILVDKDDTFGTITTSTNILFEIYTPYKPSEEEFFYEVGNMYSITSPGTSSRAYSTTLGVLTGDVYLISRETEASDTFTAEAMNIRDKFWTSWYTDISKAFPKVLGKRLHKPYSIRFSDSYILGTELNGNSTFLVLNEETIDENNGWIQKLVLADKTQKDLGNVMLAICTNTTNSIYLDEAQISDTTGSVFFTKTEGVIGSINQLHGGYGTKHPESVVNMRGFVFWYDQINGSFIQYAGNGLFPVSNYGLKRVSKLFSDNLTSGKVIGGADFYHNEILFTIPQTTDVPPKGWLDDYFSLSNVYSVRQITRLGSTYYAFSGYFVYLNASDGWPYDGYYLIVSTITNLDDEPSVPAYPALIDYPQTVILSGLYATNATTEEELTEYVASIFFDAATINPAPGALQVHSYEYEEIADVIRVGQDATDRVYPYDIYDGKAKTLAFKFGADGWLGEFTFVPEWIINLDNTLYAFKNGGLYKHTNETYNTFFGTAYPSELMLIENNEPSRLKSFLSIAIEGNMPPTYVHLRTETPNIQSSDLYANEFVNREGVYYAHILRDRLSPNISGTPEIKAALGDRMFGAWMKCWLKFETTSLLQLRFVDISSKQNSGHKTI